MTANGKPSILVIPRPSLYRQLFSPQSDALLRSLGRVEFHDSENDLTSDELARRVAEFDVVVTGWRAPRFTDRVLENAGKLRLIAHSAGSVKFMLDDACLERGIEVTCVAIAMAPSVAETTLMFIMMGLRPLHRFDRALKDGEDWRTIKTAGTGLPEIAAQRIGVIGAGNTGRAVIKLLRAVGANVCVYDPYLSDASAGELGAEKIASLDELLASCRVVTLQAPATPETRNMIGKRELAMLQDGALFVNTARSWLVDSDALLAELKSGRISGAIDVFDEEPLPPESPFRKLGDNVIITPHIASATRQCHLRQGEITVEEVRRFVSGKPLKYGINREMLATMA